MVYWPGQHRANFCISQEELLCLSVHLSLSTVTPNPSILAQSFGAQHKMLCRQKQGGNLTNHLSPQQHELGNRVLSLAESSSRKETPDHQPQVMPLAGVLTTYQCLQLSRSSGNRDAPHHLQIILPIHPKPQPAVCSCPPACAKAQGGIPGEVSPAGPGAELGDPCGSFLTQDIS